MKKLLSLLLALSLVLSLCACGQTSGDPTQPPTETTGTTGEFVVTGTGEALASEDNALVFYEIFVGSFSDSDGDGTGDLRGIINRMDYLNDGDPNSGLSLGVEGIWLTPIFVSPSYHKYDVADYYAIDPKFGTEEDLKELIDLCHSRGVKLILDLVINHTSTNHPWFREFTAARQAGDTENEYFDFYTCVDEPINGRTWYNVSGTTAYYEGNFSDVMPELNYENEAVRQAVVDVSKYYLDMGIDGFRFDAAKYIYFGETEKNADFWNWYMGELRAIKSDVYTVAEVWDSDVVALPYFASTNCFNFSMSQVQGKIGAATNSGNVEGLMKYTKQYLDAIREQKDDAMLITFIANHDTDRAAGFLPPHNGKAQMAANLSLLLPGSPFIYYGEEIGLKGSRGGSNTDANRRLAMLWGDGDTVKDPMGADYAAEQNNGTVADQLPDGSSLLNHYKKVIMIRKANPEIARGEFTPLSIPGAGGFLSTWNGSTVAVIHNASLESVTIDLSQITEATLTELRAFVGMGGATLEGSTLTLDAQTSAVLK